MTSPHEANRAKALADLRVMYEANESDIAMYREMLRIAWNYGNDYEVDRVTQELREREANRDEYVQEASDLGLTPQELEP